MNTKTSIYDYDNDFAHYEINEKERKKLGQVWTPYSIIVKMMDKVDSSIWKDETRTTFDPTMGTGNIVIAMLYRRIVEYKQDPLKALKNTYGVELDQKTLDYAHKRIEKFMAHFTKSKKKVHEIVMKNFVCSDIFKWNILEWRPKTPEEIERDEKEKKEKKKKLEQEEKEKKRKLEQENNLARFGLSKKSEEEIMAELGLVY